MYTFPVRPRTLKRLAEMANPTTQVSGGQSEALAWILYDTQLYVSTTTTQLTFFGAAPANRFLGNSTGQGIPTPQYFECYFWGLQPLIAPGNLAALNNVFQLTNGAGGAALQGTPTWTFTLADKQMGPFPASSLHGLGGPTGFTTQTTTEYANNGGLDNTFSSDGAVVIPPTQSFQVDMRWPAALTLAADTQLVFWIAGVLHRRIL